MAVENRLAALLLTALMPCHVAERVKVVVRLRPPFTHENGGAVTVNSDHTAISVFRE